MKKTFNKPAFIVFRVKRREIITESTNVSDEGNSDGMHAAGRIAGYNAVMIEDDGE